MEGCGTLPCSVIPAVIQSRCGHSCRPAARHIPLGEPRQDPVEIGEALLRVEARSASLPRVPRSPHPACRRAPSRAGRGPPPWYRRRRPLQHLDVEPGLGEPALQLGGKTVLPGSRSRRSGCRRGHQAHGLALGSGAGSMPTASKAKPSANPLPKEGLEPSGPVDLPENRLTCPLRVRRSGARASVEVHPANPRHDPLSSARPTVMLALERLEVSLKSPAGTVHILRGWTCPSAPRGGRDRWALGGGKSTLMMIAPGWKKPLRGGSSSPAKTDADERGRACPLSPASHRIVFQSSTWPTMSALENVAIRWSWRTPRRLRARRRGLASGRARPCLAHYPDQLSGGEQQRVPCPRFVPPSLILADEPTGNLDLATAGDHRSPVRDPRQTGATLVLITQTRHSHRAPTASSAWSTQVASDGTAADCDAAATGDADQAASAARLAFREMRANSSRAIHCLLVLGCRASPPSVDLGRAHRAIQEQTRTLLAVMSESTSSSDRRTKRAGLAREQRRLSSMSLSTPWPRRTGHRAWWNLGRRCVLSVLADRARTQSDFRPARLHRCHWASLSNRRCRLARDRIGDALRIGEAAYRVRASSAPA